MTDGYYHVFLVDGPLGGEMIGLTVGDGKKFPQSLTFAPMPPGTPGIVADNWAIVDWGVSPLYVFPGSAKYEFDPVASIMRATRGMAIYAYADGAE